MLSGIEFIYKGKFRYSDREIIDVDISKKKINFHLLLYTDEFNGKLACSTFRPRQNQGEYEFPGTWVGSAPVTAYRDLAVVVDYISRLPKWEDYQEGIFLLLHAAEALPSDDLPF